MYGNNVEKDESKAFEYYQKGACLWDGESLFWTGFCYANGIAIEKDEQKAFEYYKRSSEVRHKNGIFKTAFCYFYGIGVEKKDGFIWEKDDFATYIYRFYNHDCCKKCGYATYVENDFYGIDWCKYCDIDLIVYQWTSGNKTVDEFVKSIQFRTDYLRFIIEWIPFERLTDIKEIGRGGFGVVYSATWLDGSRNIFDSENWKSRNLNETVALKASYSSKEIPFLKDLLNQYKCMNGYGTIISLYGLTQNKETNENMMVMQHADQGNLRKFLGSNFKEFNWKNKLKCLENIADDLYWIHSLGFIHADFHSGNILKLTSDKKSTRVTDFGLARKEDENDLNGEIYGVMPYVAPEVLQGNQITQASDIYSFDVIMAEMTTGQRPFDGEKFDTKLACKIIRGSRPELASGTPKCYVELAMKCMDVDPEKRPKAYDLWSTIYHWDKDMNNKDLNEIKKQFLEADKIVRELPLLKHPDQMYTSKLISTKQISESLSKYIEIDNDL